MSEAITKDMIIEDVVKKFPKTIPVFMAHGLHCVGCHVANFETIEQGAAGHGITDLSKLMVDLNKAAEAAE
jgi:hybrid cluster-associated redox disulfide protein